MNKSKSKPTNEKLYNRIKSLAKKKFHVYPSIYANSWVVKEYKKRGGTYSGKRTNKSGLSRWYLEKWIDVCKLPKRVSCGRHKLSSKKWKRGYPYCRPSVRVNKNTPVIASKLSKAQIKRRCSLKHKNPIRRMSGKNMSRRKPSRMSRRKSSRMSRRKPSRMSRRK
jgi:hypothetical protein